MSATQPWVENVQTRMTELCNQANEKVSKQAYDDAKNLYSAALSLGEASMNRHMRIGVRESLGKCYTFLKKYSEAADCNRQTLKLIEKWSDKYGPQHPDLLNIRYSLARNLSALAEHPKKGIDVPTVLREAVELQTKNLEILKSKSKPEGLIELQYNLAYDLVTLGRSQADRSEKKQLFQRAAVLDEQVYQARKATAKQARDQSLIKSRHNYAVCLYYLKDYNKAKQLLLENQTILDTLSDDETRGLAALVLNADRYLAACIEATKDLSLGISRRPTDPLRTIQINHGAKPVRSSSVRAERPPKELKSPTIAIEPARESKVTTPKFGSPSSPKFEGLNIRLNSHLRQEGHSERRSSTDSSKHKGQPKDGKADVKTQRESDRVGRPSQKPPAATASSKDAAARPSSGPHLSPKLDILHKRSRSDDNQKPKVTSLALEKFGKPRSHSSAGERPPERRASQVLDASTIVTGELFSVPANSSDADSWMLRLRHYAHKLLQYHKSFPTRKRIRVAVLDSGVQRGHDRASSRSDIWRQRWRLKDYKDFTGTNADWTDSSKDLHGTNCVSLLLQVAPETDVYVANVVNSSVDGFDPAHVANALKWAINEKHVDIISMSLGWQEWKSLVAEQLINARQKNVLVFAAGSNEGHFGNDRGAFPAWDPTVLCICSSRGIGATSDFNPKYTDEKVNFLFLGEEVAILGSNNKPELQVNRLTGTSFATPIAVGTAALVLDLARWQVSEYPMVEQTLKLYEGMSAVFKEMSGKPTQDGYYHVRPWTVLGTLRPPFAPHGIGPSIEWYTLERICECLKRFGFGNVGD